MEGRRLARHQASADDPGCLPGRSPGVLRDGPSGAARCRARQIRREAKLKATVRRTASVVGVGLVLSATAGAIGGWASFGGGVVATGSQVAAVGLLFPKMAAPVNVFVRRWVGGMAVRLVGLALAIILFAPLAGMLGFLGVLLPLLFTETMFLR